MDFFHRSAVKYVFVPLLTVRGRSSALKIEKNLRQTERADPDWIRGLQLKRLRTMLGYAIQHVPYYRKKLRELDFEIGDLKSFSDFENLPLLHKRDIQENRERLISNEYRKDELIVNRTGGSTASPLVFYHERTRWDSREAATWRHNAWAGYSRGDRVALLWNHQSDLDGLRSIKAKIRQRLIERMIVCDTTEVTTQSLSDFTQKFKAFRPEIILGFANSLIEYMEFLKTTSDVVPSPRAIISTAEVLSNSDRVRLERFFGASVYNRYGCRETSVIASECEAHSGMHINAENLYLEFLNGDRSCELGAGRDIVVTDLGNFAFPFIRYKIGDVGEPDFNTCTCGRTLPKMKILSGRDTDFLKSPSGRRISGIAYLTFAIARIPGLLQAQVVQNRLGALRMRIVKGTEFSQDSISALQKLTDHYFGSHMDIDLVYVSRIERERSGKFRFSICELKGEEDSVVSG